MRLPQLLTLCLLLFSVALSAQLESRYVMAASFSNITSLTTTTHQVTLNFQSDQLGSGYLANQIQTGWRVLTSTRREYEITTINSSNFSSAQVVLTEIEGTTLAPNGVGVVYAYDGTSRKVPPLPVNSTGISAALQAVILIHNFEVDEAGSGGVSSWNDLEDVPPGFSDGVDNEGTDDQTWNEIGGKPAGFADNVDNVDDADNVIGNEDNRLSLDGRDLVLKKADNTTELDRVTIPSEAQSVFASSEGALNVRMFFRGVGNPSLGGNPTSGYTIAPAGGEVQAGKIQVKGNSTTANASGELVLIITTTDDLVTGFAYQLYDLTNNQKVDVHLTGNVATQTVNESTGEVRFTLPNISGNYPNGFRLILN